MFHCVWPCIGGQGHSSLRSGNGGVVSGSTDHGDVAGRWPHEVGHETTSWRGQWAYLSYLYWTYQSLLNIPILIEYISPYQSLLNIWVLTEYIILTEYISPYWIHQSLLNTPVHTEYFSLYRIHQSLLNISVFIEYISPYWIYQCLLNISVLIRPYWIHQSLLNTIYQSLLNTQPLLNISVLNEYTSTSVLTEYITLTEYVSPYWLHLSLVNTLVLTDHISPYW